MSQSNPKFSIILTTKNQERNFKKSLASVFSQSYKNYEIIIVDDASNSVYDLSGLEHYTKRYSIKYIKNSEPLGNFESKNIAFKSSEGEYLIFVEEWCELDRNFLLGVHEFCGNCKSNSYFLWSTLFTIGAMRDKSSAQRRTWDRRLLIDKYNVERLLTTSVEWGVVIPKCYFENVGGFNSSFYYYGDIDLFVRLVNYGATPYENPRSSIYLYEERKDNPEETVESMQKKINELSVIFDTHTSFFERYFHCKSSLFWKIEQSKLELSDILQA
ncbi:glycosyltransferase family 2 protein [Teredinibacter sp. KSP-S5-2]|uniref:glycosyltransferase family 2 protein n=1 Tax=Teredinibacter sp. KSP-S5-2 TaxID=3034506 RepID=UPI002934FA4D|nr:glycosyltransferase [Teredinibacter sp. KSP-S5-2]WNO11322.1 glycosyltransferase [Teredinibacter sp. KSP-S5-2]